MAEGARYNGVFQVLAEEDEEPKQPGAESDSDSSVGAWRSAASRDDGDSGTDEEVRSSSSSGAEKREAKKRPVGGRPRWRVRGTGQTLQERYGSGFVQARGSAVAASAEAVAQKTSRSTKRLLWRSLCREVRGGSDRSAVWRTAKECGSWVAEELEAVILDPVITPLKYVELLAAQNKY